MNASTYASSCTYNVTHNTVKVLKFSGPNFVMIPIITSLFSSYQLFFSVCDFHLSQVSHILNAPQSFEWLTPLPLLLLLPMIDLCRAGRTLADPTHRVFAEASRPRQYLCSLFSCIMENVFIVIVFHPVNISLMQLLVMLCRSSMFTWGIINNNKNGNYSAFNLLLD